MPTDQSDSPDIVASSPPSARLLGKTGVLWQALRDTWDRLGLVVAMSLTGMLTISIAFSITKLFAHWMPSGVAGAIGTVAGLLLFALPLGGAYRMAHRIAVRDEVSYGLFLSEGRRLYKPTLLLLAINLLVLGGLGANLWFYFRIGGIGGFLALLLCCYVTLFCTLMMLSHFPILVAQEEGSFDDPDKPARRGALPVLRRAFYLTLGRPFYALSLGLIALPVTLVSLFTGVLMALFWLGFMAILLTHSTRALLVQFGVLPPPPPEEEIIPDEEFRIDIQSNQWKEDSETKIGERKSGERTIKERSLRKEDS